MKCTVQGCPGEYEKKKITHTVRHHEQIIVIDCVPAEVCSICGDTLFNLATVRKLEQMLQENPRTEKMVPLYEYVQ